MPNTAIIRAEVTADDGTVVLVAAGNPGEYLVAHEGVRYTVLGDFAAAEAEALNFAAQIAATRPALTAAEAASAAVQSYADAQQALADKAAVAAVAEPTP
jgi:hypothetical protein